ARRDWAQELRGRRGLLFGAVTTVLLLPAATVELDLPEADELPVARILATGDVPEAVAALPEVVVHPERGHLRFTRADDGALVVRGQAIPARVRDAMDGERPEVRLEPVGREPMLPGRTI